MRNHRESEITCTLGTVYVDPYTTTGVCMYCYT